MSYVNWLNSMDNNTFCESGQGLDTMMIAFFDEFKEFAHRVSSLGDNSPSVHFNNTYAEDGHVSFDVTVKEDDVKTFSEQVDTIMGDGDLNNMVGLSKAGNVFNFRFKPDSTSFPVSLHTN